MAHGQLDLIFAPELIRCVAEGHKPNVAELFSVACRVWVEGAAERSVFGWDRLSPEHPDRVRALRVALAAMAGEHRSTNDTPVRGWSLCKTRVTRRSV